MFALAWIIAPIIAPSTASIAAPIIATNITLIAHGSHLFRVGRTGPGVGEVEDRAPEGALAHGHRPRRGRDPSVAVPPGRGLLRAGPGFLSVEWGLTGGHGSTS